MNAKEFVLSLRKRRPIVVKDWNKAKEIMERNAVELEQKGFDANIVNFELAGEALDVHNMLNKIKEENK